MANGVRIHCTAVPVPALTRDDRRDSVSAPNDPARRTKPSLLWLTTGDLGHAAVTQLSRLFNLTRAEEHLLAQLVTGVGVRGAAARHNIGIHTPAIS